MRRAKWTAADYTTQTQPWKPPPLIYPCDDTEKDGLKALRDTFQPLSPYKQMETEATEQESLVSIEIPVPTDYIAFLENTGEKCTSATTKHSRQGMEGALHWVQRVDTPYNAFRRLTDGYGVSLMFGERYKNKIRNSNNWRGAFGCMLDIDMFQEHPDTIRKKAEAESISPELLEKRLKENEARPEPCYSQAELFDRYPLLKKICSFLIPSASSLHDGRPFKARGIVLFPEPITDQRVYRVFGDILCDKLDCIPQGVTKNPVAVGFGNTHNATQAYHNTEPATDWINAAIQNAKTTVLETATERKAQQERKAEQQARRNTQQRGNNTGNGKGSTGENITAFIDQCDPVAEMVKAKLLTRGKGNEYRWYEASSDRSCEVMGDGVLHIFSNTMQQASPAPPPINAHRFYLYQLTGLDLARTVDQPKCREYLYEHGYGDDPNTHTRRTKAKLHRTENAPTPTETLDEKRTRLETATDPFLTDTPAPDTIHVFLVNANTGIGKTRTLLAKAKQHGKRTLMRTPTIALAEQAVNDAGLEGFKSPQHLLGREHNWEASGIEQIPPAERTSDLFLKNQCIMVDKAKEYSDKRLAPRTYCEHACQHRDNCLHLAQYDGLGEKDFIATSSPNVIFDLNLRGYLVSLVTATGETSDTDLAIDAMWGTQSEPTTEFDLAIIDDYDINGLYTDLTLSKTEFKRLKEAWKGTPTAEFAKGILKAFKKKKPHAIVKALRKAIDSTVEHHEAIAKHMTQHARHGTVEYTDIPQHSKETERLLTEKQVRYTDGGTQFIPVDIEAYKELTVKGIPAIAPQHLETTAVGEQVRIPHTPLRALMAGVPIDALTPIWQAGTTPINTLKIFLASIGNNTNAPVAKAYRAGETPDPVLTFTIPPQAPVGILPHIALLSATTDTADVQHAFDGQPITFSVHTGGQVEWADGVQVYQFTDARLTSASVFEYPTDVDGKRKLQETPIGLTPTATQRLAKLNDWAKATDGKTAFVSYKEFTEAPFSEAVNGFDIVTHFDKVVGLNFKGLKYLVVFGYPKVKHEVVMEHARKQYARDTEPLPKGAPNLRDDNGKEISEYIQLTDEVTCTENGITSTERRYTDTRLEKIRHQLAIDKLIQAFGRARHPVWKDTQTIIFTAAPLGSTTERATLFSAAAFNLAENASGLLDAMHRIQEAETTGDVQSVMETQQIGKSQAYAKTKATRDQQKSDRDAKVMAQHAQEKTPTEIAQETGIKRTTIVSIIKRNTRDENSSHQLVLSNWQSEKSSHVPNTDVTDIELETRHTKPPCERTDTPQRVFKTHQRSRARRTGKSRGTTQLRRSKTATRPHQTPTTQRNPATETPHKRATPACNATAIRTA